MILLKSYVFEEDTSIQELNRLYHQYGRCHIVHAGEVIEEFQESKKPLATTRGNSYPNQS